MARKLKKATPPVGAAVNFTYNDAHRLMAIAESVGNQVKEEVKGPAGALARRTSRVYDALNRLQQITGGNSMKLMEAKSIFASCIRHIKCIFVGINLLFLSASVNAALPSVWQSASGYFYPQSFASLQQLCDATYAWKVGAGYKIDGTPPTGYIVLKNGFGCGFVHTIYNPELLGFETGNRVVSLSCSAGQYPDSHGTTCVYPNSGKTPGPPCPTCGTNPIHPAIGNKYQHEQDYLGSGSFPLRYERSYNSVSIQSKSVGANWRGSFDRAINLDTPSSTTATVIRPNGKAYYFSLVNGAWLPDADINDRLTRLIDASNNPSGWLYTAATDEVETYDINGRLVSIKNRAGLAQTLTYDTNGLLTTVADPFGRQLKFTYDAARRLITMTDPAGGVYKYAYGNYNDLRSVTYPDGKVRQYLYNYASYGINQLVGIIDENNVRFATWAYDAQGRAVSSEHAEGVEKVTLTYTVDANTNQNAVTTVTDPLGTVRTYTFKAILGAIRNTDVSGPCSSCGTTASMAYDANGNIASRTDFNGNKTTYTYDLSRNLETSRVEGASTTSARTITTEWHPTYHLITRQAEPLRITANTYDSNGNLLTKAVQSTSDADGSLGFATATVGSPRVWRYTYNQYGQILTATGPRTDVNDTTSYAYDNAGNLISITNPAGQVTTLSNYDANGRVGTITDPNGLVTNLTYSPRGWLTSKSVGGEVTSYDYDGVGQLVKVTQPDGSSISYTYDGARRLTAIADSIGNSVAYTLDAMGNRVKEQVKDPAGALAQQTTRVYDALNRLQQITGGGQ